MSLVPWRQAGVLGAVDVHLARALGRLVPATDDTVLLGAALAARAPGVGHVCVELSGIRDAVRLEEGDETEQLPWPEPEAWRQALASSRLVGDGEPITPLVLEGDRLYLHRLWSYQRRLADALRLRARDFVDVDQEVLADGLSRLFPDAGQQALAAAVALTRKLAIITGGPGTGKTTTVVRLLALVLEQRPTARIALLAPTGKAAARMAESVRTQLDDLAVDESVKAAVPSEAATIHRALGWQPDKPTRFRHGADDPLPVDVVVVDECSMVDLALMAKLVEAVPANARLVLLGDRDQLASVEAGTVLADLCGAGLPPRGASTALRERLRALDPGLESRLDDPGTLGAGEAPTAQAALPMTTVSGPAAAPGAPGLQDSLVELTRTYRFDEKSGIGTLARALRAGRGPLATALLRHERTFHPEGRPYADLALFELDDVDALRAQVVEGYRGLCLAPDPAEALRALDRFRVLCAHRRGARGVEALNRAAARWLAAAGLLRPEGRHYPGLPVLVTRNDYGLGLFNGDVGVLATDPDTGSLRAWFPYRDGLRALHPARLPAHEPVFAMTVHKSQGSEVDEVLLVLPEVHTRVLTRELLYTGVTRARRSVVVAGSAEVLEAGIADPVRRASGLRDLLWGPP